MSGLPFSLKLLAVASCMLMINELVDSEDFEDCDVSFAESISENLEEADTHEWVAGAFFFQGAHFFALLRLR